AITGWLISRGWVQAREPTVIFTLACALTPLLVFNQQVLTGRSLQPFHYEVFIGSYTTVLAAFVTTILCCRGLAINRPALVRVLITALAVGAILSGTAEATLMSR